MIADSAILDRFAKAFAAREGEVAGARHAPLAAARATAFADFAARGLPTQKLEAWKYTSLNPLRDMALVPAPRVAARAAALPWLLPKGKSHRLAFVNGRLDAKSSAPGKLPKGARLMSLAEALEAEPSLLDESLSRVKSPSALASLNAAFLEDGYVLRLEDGVVLERPVELIFLAAPGAEPVAYYPRGLVRLGANARAMLIEQHVGPDTGAYFADLVADIELGPGAALGHYKHQAEGAGAVHIATHRVTVGRGARYESFVLSAGAKVARTEIATALAAPGASCRLDGAYFGRGRQAIDNTTSIDHLAPDTSSRETYKGVLDEGARGVFQGRIEVHPGADRTDGRQTCRTLLLSNGAEIDAKPELLIYADDVKCAHGAAAGALDGDALFYLRSRGIPEPEARRMLVEAFLADAVAGIARDEVRGAFGRIVAGWLGAGTPASAVE
ncbi:MAG TPA: Fe-S cluster assembly protein SufD [Alphaproteobacteria bacterium]|nr:Fe-S cluster assembly protein SufD [Alphaproteobacteria bacterium]